MSATQDYVGNIKDTVTSFWHGMSITLSHLFRRPTTIQYPDRLEKPITELLAPRYRGFLEADVGACTGCQACERACPIACIAIAVEKSPADPKQRLITRFDIDAAKCMYCGLCVEACPTGALVHTREFEGSCRHLDNLIFRFVDPLAPAPVYKIVKGVEAPRKPAGELVRAQVKAWDAPPPFFRKDSETR